jgi:putative colanic acid biosynthesis UDP-glucose lipid carrier transferase
MFFTYAVTLFKAVPDLSRMWLLLWICSGYLMSAGLRMLFYSVAHRLRTKGVNQKKVLLVGTGGSCQRIRQKMEHSPHFGFVFEADFFVGSEHASEGYDCHSLVERIGCEPPDEAWIAFPLSAGHLVRDIHESLNRSTVNIRYIPDLSDFRLFNHQVTQIGPLLAVDLSKTPFEGGARIIKAVEDYLFGLFFFLISLPVMLVIAAAIKITSPGPVIFKQYRAGLDGKPFKIYKFRSMTYNPDGGFKQAQYVDPRVTRLGHWLRKTSLDELPQFLNVLQGRMSIVGPRPHVPEQNSYYADVIDGYMQRHRVKPGITGWAQINGLRGLTDKDDDMRKRVEYDFYYINKWSFLFDLKIMVLTVVHGFINKQP